MMESFPIDVIVRAFASEPVHLTATRRISADIVEVVGEDGSKSIGFPLDAVFLFDQSLFRKLRAAYDAGQQDNLENAWNEAEPMIA